MKCPKCAGDTRRVSAGEKCSSCSYHFVFGKGEPITDKAFASLIRRASRGGTYYFTKEHLYAEYCIAKKLKFTAAYERQWTTSSTTLLLVGAGATVAGIMTATAAAIGLGPLVAACALFARRKVETSPAYTEAPSRGVFESLLARWPREDKLLTSPALHKPPEMRGKQGEYRSIATEDFDFGVEKIVIVDEDILVDLLVRNHAHAEQKALIVSESGYPEYLQPKVARCLKVRPDLPVILLHSSDRGDMAARVRNSAKYPLKTARVIDAGLSQQQVASSNFIKSTELKSDGAISVQYLPYPIIVRGLASAVAGGFAAAGVLLPHHVDAATGKPRESTTSTYAEGGGGGDTGTATGDFSDIGDGDVDGGDADFG